MSEEKVGDDEPGWSGETPAASSVPRLQAHSAQPVAPRASLDTRFRRTMGLFATGVTVITTRMNGSVHGMTANSVTSLSLEPLLMQVAINRRATMCNIIQQAGEFAINILSERQEELSHYFGGAKTDPPPASLRFEPDPDSAPYIHDALAAIHCRIERVVNGWDHVIVLGRVVHFRDGSDYAKRGSDLGYRNRYWSSTDAQLIFTPLTRKSPCVAGRGRLARSIVL